jgi:hypothetical protein
MEVVMVEVFLFVTLGSRWGSVKNQFLCLAVLEVEHGQAQVLSLVVFLVEHGLVLALVAFLVGLL